jgi:AraC family transcriptional regulator
MATTKRKESPAVQLEEPRFEDGKALLIAGFRNRYSAETMNNIPHQWQRFAPHIGSVPGQVGRVTYGLTFLSRNDEGIDYLTGVEVSSCSGLPDEFRCVSIPAQRYAVFAHREHVSKLSETCDAIGKKWFPESGYELARGSAEVPDSFERYTEEFDPQTGMGGMEVWVPIKL